MRRCVLALTVTAALGGATSASARPSAVGVALQKAEQIWHAQPCGGRYTVKMTQTDEWAGHAFFNTPTGPGYYTSPANTWTECVLALNANEWSSREEIEVEWRDLCTIVLHEYGHLLGHVHSDEAQFTDAPGTPPETPEQSVVMRSGGFLPGALPTVPDVRRCGRTPYPQRHR